jgi:hypothetical protein
MQLASLSWDVVSPECALNAHELRGSYRITVPANEELAPWAAGWLFDDPPMVSGHSAHIDASSGRREDSGPPANLPGPAGGKRSQND